MEANALRGADTISLPAGIYALSIPGVREDAAASGDLDITDDLTIRGGGAAATIVYGAGLDRVFDILGVLIVNISDVTIRSGNTTDRGGGVFIHRGSELLPTMGRIGATILTLTNARVSGNSASRGGGGISNAGTLVLANSTVSRNSGGGIASTFDAAITDTSISGNTGGGINNFSGTVTLTNSTVSGNSAGEHGGGGINNNSGTVTVTGSTISENTSALFGGGITNGGAMTLANSTVRGNSATHGGGGIYQSGGAMTLTNTTISGNSASRGTGGGIHIHTGEVRLHESTISGNSASSGGGISNFGEIHISASTFSRNAADNNGGGIDTSGGTVTLTNSTLSGNTAAEAGGGINNRSRRVTVINSTISDNSAGVRGGGIHNQGTLSMTNSIVSGNAALYPGDCAVWFVRMPPRGRGGGVTSLGHNLDTDGTCDLTQATDLPSTEPRLGALQDNGGPTFTHRLLPGTPAIGAGDPAACPATDQRGVARPQGGGCDIGAYESGGQFPAA